MNLIDLIELLKQISTDHHEELSVEFQDYDHDERNVNFQVETVQCYTDSSESFKKLVIRYL